MHAWSVWAISINLVTESEHMGMRLLPIHTHRKQKDAAYNGHPIRDSHTQLILFALLVTVCDHSCKLKARNILIYFVSFALLTQCSDQLCVNPS